MWTDSTTVLHWIHFLEKQPVFVANRIAEISELTTADEWHHVPSADNPADAATRGLSAKDLLNRHWLRGPDFLRTPDWPFKASENLQLKLKSRKGVLQPDTEIIPTTTLVATKATIASTFEWQNYSSYEKLLRIVACMLRLLPKNSHYRSKTGAIAEPVELHNAELRLLTPAQKEPFPT